MNEYKNYYIALIDNDKNEWGILESTDFNYISRVFEDMSAPPDYCSIELRGTNEDIDTHLDYEVLRYDRR